VKKYGGGAGYVDLFWPGILLVEMKSRGKNLDRAYTQAMDYFPGIVERDCRASCWCATSRASGCST
jgi:hypothetical protein